MILSFDPSMTCTGWALLSRDGESILAMGTISLPDGSLADRLFSLQADARTVCIENGQRVEFMVVERPEDNPVGGGRQRFKRSVLTLPSYGAAFASVLLATQGWPVITPSPIEWIGQGRIPSSSGDEHKERRVRWVEGLYHLPEGSLGVKTKAGNVADAILLGRFAAAVGPTWRPAGKRKRERVVVTVRPQGGKG